MICMDNQPTPPLATLERQILEEALQEVIAGGPELCDSASLCVLTQTAQVCFAAERGHGHRRLPPPPPLPSSLAPVREAMPPPPFHAGLTCSAAAKAVCIQRQR
jgi:hypothetical protein